MLHKYKPLTFDGSSNKLLHQKGTYFYKQKWFSNISYSIPIACSIALLGGLGLAINPIGGNGISSSSSAYAEGGDDYGISTLADNALSLTLGNTAATNPDLGGSTELFEGTTVYRPYGFSVTAPAGGYKIYVQSAAGYTGELRGLANPKETIGGVGSNVVGNSFPDNTWGYHVEAGTPSNTAYGGYTYSTVPNNGDSMRAAKMSDNTNAVTNKAYTVIFGAKVGDDKPADHYQTKVLLSLTASATEVGLMHNSITDMQQVTVSICENSNIGDTKRLKDTRDNKLYWVAKLADGNCWMTQNLDYDGGGVAAATLANWDNNDDKAQYYNLGMYVYTTPTTINDCSLVSSLAECTNWTQVGANTDYPDAGTTTMTSVLVGNTYDAHYLVGNYYSWLAATNGSGKDLWEDGSKAPGSVCPQGWKLPLAGDSIGSNNNKSGSFRNLLNRYGFSFNANGKSESLEGIISDARYNIAGAPLYFLRGGGVSQYTLGSVGIGSYYWSRVASSSVTAYVLHFNSTDVYPSASISRFSGFHIRCVVY